MSNELRLAVMLCAFCCLLSNASARVQSGQGVRRPSLPAPAAPRDDESKAKLYGVKNAEDADEWFARGDELERSGDNDGARAAFAEAVKHHLKLYLAETSGAHRV